MAVSVKAGVYGPQSSSSCPDLKDVNDIGGLLLGMEWGRWTMTEDYLTRIHDII
jgi:hypothetical protein